MTREVCNKSSFGLLVGLSVKYDGPHYKSLPVNWTLPCVNECDHKHCSYAAKSFVQPCNHKLIILHAVWCMRWRTETGRMLLPHPRATQPHSTCRVRFYKLEINRIVCLWVLRYNLCCAYYSCSAPKNEDAYEIAIPYEEGNFEQQGFFNQSDQNFDGECHFYL